MRLLFIVDNITQGGAGRVVSVLADHLSDEHEVSVLLMAQMELKDSDYIRNNRIHFLFMSQEAHSNTPTPTAKLKVLRNLFKSNNFDVAIAFINEYGEYAVIASLFTKIKVVVSERTDPHVSPTNKILRMLRNPLYGLADKAVFQTEDMRDFFPEYVRKKGTIIFNPINNKLPAPYRGKREKRIVSVGRLNEAKNFQMAIRAFATFRETHKDYLYEIYGEGPYRKDLENIISDLNLNGQVILKGHKENVDALILSAGMFVMPSNFEGMSNALNEALAMGIPTISTDHPIGAARLIIKDHENGILIPVNDQDALLKAMLEIADNEMIAQRLSNEAVRIRDELSIDNISAKWISCCQEIITPRGNYHGK